MTKIINKGTRNTKYMHIDSNNVSVPFCSAFYFTVLGIAVELHTGWESTLPLSMSPILKTRLEGLAGRLHGSLKV